MHSVTTEGASRFPKANYLAAIAASGVDELYVVTGSGIWRCDGEGVGADGAAVVLFASLALSTVGYALIRRTHPRLSGATAHMTVSRCNIQHSLASCAFTRRELGAPPKLTTCVFPFASSSTHHGRAAARARIRHHRARRHGRNRPQDTR